MSGYWSNPQVLQKLAYLFGDTCTFVHTCFLKHDPKSEDCEGQKLRNWPLEHKSQVEWAERMGLLICGYWMVDSQGQWFGGPTLGSCLPARPHNLTGLRAAAFKFNHSKTVLFTLCLSPQEFEGLCRHPCIYLHITPWEASWSKCYLPFTGCGTKAGKQVFCVPGETRVTKGRATCSGHSEGARLAHTQGWTLPSSSRGILLMIK